MEETWMVNCRAAHRVSVRPRADDTGHGGRSDTPSPFTRKDFNGSAFSNWACFNANGAPPVPEPSTYTLLLLGAMSLLCMKRLPIKKANSVTIRVFR
jgi:hypothetical protein